MTREGLLWRVVVQMVLICAASLASVAARADTEAGPFRIETGVYGPWKVTGDVEVGGRAMTGDFGSAKFGEYQDFRPGPFARGLVLIEDEALRHYVRAQMEYVGSFDQLYRVEGGAWGRWGLDLGYSEYPHHVYDDGRTLYRRGDDAVFTLPAGLQNQLQPVPASAAFTAARRSAALGTALRAAGGVPLGIQIQQGHAEGFYRPTEELEGSLRYWTQQRSGDRRLSIAFGSPGGNFANFAAPVDDRTQEVRARLEWARPGWSLAFGYDGSFYEDELDSITVANPVRATDSATAGARNGRLSVAPDNSAHGFNLTGSALVPVGFPLRVAGTFGYQLRLQDDDFLPQTSNTAITSPLLAPALSRDGLHGQVNAWLGNVVVSGNPLRDLDFALRYRVYAFDNTTGVFGFPAEVVSDATFRTTEPENSRHRPLDWMRQNLGFDVGYRLTKKLKLDLDMAWERWRRSQYREVRNQNDHVLGAHLEARPVEWAVIRTGYTWADRRWGTYVTQHLPEEFSEVRKFDVANRIENAVDLLAQFTPLETLDLSVSGSYGYWNYESSDFGLVNTQYWTAGGDVSYHPFEWLGLSAYYTYESNRDNQTSRNRPVVGGVAIDLPSNNWYSRFKSGVSTAGASVDVAVWPQRVDLRLDWLFETSQNNTLTTGASAAAGAFGWPRNGDDLLSIGPTLSVHLSEHVTVRGAYHYEHYRLNDFQIDGLNPYMPFASANSVDIFLGNRQNGYDAHVFGLSAQYKF